jgi:mono/diheme cytochrome c family protein
MSIGPRRSFLIQVNTDLLPCHSFFACAEPFRERALVNSSLKYLLIVGILGPLNTPALAQAEDVGKMEFVSNCASCHGTAGKGDGPASAALRTRPPDLTLLARNNDGVFPTEVLHQIIDGRRTLRAHGNYEMPVWGGTISREQILAIGDYLRGLQLK